MATLTHPQKAEIERLRRLILGVDPRVAEGVKWKAPSFRTAEYFATIHLKAQRGVALILHLGAKVRDLPAGGVAIDDPSELLKWLGKDRAMIEFATAQALNDGQAALQAVLRQWIDFV